MKKHMEIPLSFLIGAILIFSPSCKKDNNAGEENPANTSRLIKQEVIFHFENSTYVLNNKFENDKLIENENSVDEELDSRSYYTYEDQYVYQHDSLFNEYLYDSILTVNVTHQLQNNLIIKSIVENGFIETANYTYTGEKLLKWEYLNQNNDPLIKGEYTYDDGKKKSYSFYILDNEGEWDLSSKNEYTYDNDKMDEVLYYIRYDEYHEPDLIMKREIIYKGNYPEKINLYFRTLEDEWELHYITYTTYDSDGYITEAKEYATDGETEQLNMEINYTYEQGGSNLEMFYKVQAFLPFNELGYPIWINQSNSQELFEELSHRKIIE